MRLTILLLTVLTFVMLPLNVNLQGGPAKVKPTYIFDGNFECIGKIRCFGKCDNSNSGTHLGKHKFNI